MEFLRDTQIDFMKYRRGFVVVSVILVLISVLAVFVHGKLNMGIDFAGGSQLTLRFQEHPEIDELRGLLESAGFQDALIQRFGEETVNEVMIKTPLAVEEEQAEAPAPAATGEETEAEDSEERRQAQVLAALDGRFNSGVIFDLNRSGSDALAAELVKLDPEGVVAEGGDTATDYYATTAAAVIAARDEDGIFTSWDEVASAEGVSATVLDALEKNTSLGGFALLAAESVGPQIGGELLQHAHHLGRERAPVAYEVLPEVRDRRRPVASPLGLGTLLTPLVVQLPDDAAKIHGRALAHSLGGPSVPCA